MRCTQPENVQEHSLQVAIIAHALTLIKNKYFGGKISPERVALLAIFHDASEVMTGDLPTPVKYFNSEMRTAYQQLEGHATRQLLTLLPEDMRGDYHDLLFISDEESEAKNIIKAADTLSAYIKCLEEIAVGNHEFARAQKTIDDKLQILQKQPEVKYFIEHFIPSFKLSLDEISRPLNL